MTPDPRRLARRGFTLLELSVVLVIVGLLGGMTVGTMTPMMESARLTQTQTKLDAIEDALFAYRVAHGLVPCPADVTLADTNVNSGVEAATPGTCTGGNPAANKSLKNAVEGGVPVTTLGLPRDFAYDAWGQKFVYAVDKRYTGANAFATYGAPGSCGGMTVKDAAGGDRTTAAMYVLVSHGPNGHGGYNSAGLRVSASSTNADEQNNCDCDNAAAVTAYDRAYVQRATYLTSQTNQFDDIVRFKLRWQWRAPDEKTLAGNGLCSPGFRIEAAENNERIGTGLAAADMNGDGRDDLVVGSMCGAAYLTGGAYNGNGLVSVVFARSGAWDNPTLGTALNGDNGFRVWVPLNSYPELGAAGWVFSTTLYWGLKSIAVGDINNDGRADLVIGYGLANSSQGKVLVVFGRAGAWPAVVSGGACTGADCLFIYHSDTMRYGGLGSTVSVGDINGDGYDDVVLGGWSSRTGLMANMDQEQGVVFVILGKASFASGTFNLNTVDGTNGFRLISTYDGGMYGGRLGEEVAVLDINDDGYDDIAADASREETVYVVFGKAAWPASTNVYGAMTGANGFRITGAGLPRVAGPRIDLNGDGKDDLVFRQVAGMKTNVLFGSSAAWAATFDPAAINGTNGTAFTYSGSFTAGRFNGDNIDDIGLISEYEQWPTPTSNTWSVVYGKTSGWGANWDLTALPVDGTTGFTVTGQKASNNLPDSIYLDLNADGYKDIIQGSPAVYLSDSLPNGGVWVGNNDGIVRVMWGTAAGWGTTVDTTQADP